MKSENNTTPNPYQTLIDMNPSADEELLIADILSEYFATIDEMLVSTTMSDVEELGVAGELETLDDPDDLFIMAQDITKLRMIKYSKIFFDEEMDRLLLKFSDDNLARPEFLFRCNALSCIVKSLTDYGTGKKT